MAIRSACASFILLLTLTAVPHAAPRAPAQAASAILAEVHFTGSARYNEAQLAATSGLKVGDSITREQLQAVADRFLQLGLFTRASYSFTSRGNNVAVEYKIEDAPAVLVSFDNFPWFTDEELNSAVRGAVPLFDGTAPADGGMLDAIADAITKLLPAHGITGQIQHTLMAQPVGNDKMIQFRVEGARPLTIASLKYSDPLAQNSERLKDRNADLIGQPFSRLAIEIFENEQVRPIYLSTGHLQVRFGAPTILLSGDPNQPLPSQLPLVVPIEPGPVYQITSVTPIGNVAVDADTIGNFVDMKPGDLADGMKLADAWERVELEYAHRGYLDAKVNAQPEFDEAAAKVSYRLAVSEGPQYHMRDLVLTGLSTDASNALRLRWELRRGQVADGTYVEEMLNKLEKPSEEIFGDLPVHYTKVGHLLRTDPATQTVDVLIDFH